MCAPSRRRCNGFVTVHAAGGSMVTPYLPAMADQLAELGHAGSRGGVQFGEHLVEAATRRAQNEHARRLVAGIAEGVAPATRAEEETARRDAVGSPSDSMMSSPLST